MINWYRNLPATPTPPIKEGHVTKVKDGRGTNLWLRGGTRTDTDTGTGTGPNTGTNTGTGTAVGAGAGVGVGEGEVGVQGVLWPEHILLAGESNLKKIKP